MRRVTGHRDRHRAVSALYRGRSVAEGPQLGPGRYQGTVVLWAWCTVGDGEEESRDEVCPFVIYNWEANAPSGIPVQSQCISFFSGPWLRLLSIPRVQQFVMQRCIREHMFELLPRPYPHLQYAHLTQSTNPPQVNGVAMQCRVTTEDPSNNFSPDTGTASTALCLPPPATPALTLRRIMFIVTCNRRSAGRVPHARWHGHPIG